MSDQRCGTCRLFEPARNPKTGRVRPTEPGQCTWQPPEWPVMAASYYTHQRGGIRSPSWPTKHDMYRYNGTNCKTWAPKKRAKAADRQVPLIAAQE